MRTLACPPWASHVGQIGFAANSTNNIMAVINSNWNAIRKNKLMKKICAFDQISSQSSNKLK